MSHFASRQNTLVEDHVRELKCLLTVILTLAVIQLIYYLHTWTAEPQEFVAVGEWCNRGSYGSSYGKDNYQYITLFLLRDELPWFFLEGGNFLQGLLSALFVLNGISGNTIYYRELLSNFGKSLQEASVHIIIL